MFDDDDDDDDLSHSIHLVQKLWDYQKTKGKKEEALLFSCYIFNVIHLVLVDLERKKLKKNHHDDNVVNA